MGGGRISPVNETDKAEIMKRECDMLRIRLDHRIGGVKISKIAESYGTFYDQWNEYDPFVTQLEPSKGVRHLVVPLQSLTTLPPTYQTPTNPWICDSTEFWEMERQT